MNEQNPAPEVRAFRQRPDLRGRQICLAGGHRNRAGRFVTASLASTTAAAAGAQFAPDTDFRVSITDAPGAEAYPIASFTWLLIPRQADDAAKARALLEFVWWATHDGQRYTQALSYASLPAPVVRLIEAKLRTVTAGGRPVLPADYTLSATVHRHIKTNN